MRAQEQLGVIASLYDARCHYRLSTLAALEINTDIGCYILSLQKLALLWYTRPRIDLAFMYAHEYTHFHVYETQFWDIIEYNSNVLLP